MTINIPRKRAKFKGHIRTARTKIKIIVSEGGTKLKKFAKKSKPKLKKAQRVSARLGNRINMELENTPAGIRNMRLKI